MNNGQFGKKKRIQVAYLGFMHIWVLAFGNKYYLRVCYDPQFLVTKDYGNIKYRYLMMRTCRPTVKLNIYQKTDKYTRSFIFNCISVEKNLQSEICTNSL